MPPLLYSELTAWYRLVDPPADHLEEAAQYEAELIRGINGSGETLLELGAGAGHNTFHLKRRFRCTLTDLSGRDARAEPRAEPRVRAPDR